MRILFNSNAPWSVSGYGQQMAEIGPNIRDMGHEVAQVCFYGLEGNTIVLDGITMFPRLLSVWGEDSVIEHSKVFHPDITITLQDIWTTNPEALKQFVRFIPIIPVDHEPLTKTTEERARSAWRIIAMSKFGQKMLADKGLHSTYIPHSINTNIFRPIELVEKAKVRARLGIPNDIFLFGMVAANKENPPRKSFQEVLDAFNEFQKVHPKSGMYFHVNVIQPGGFPITEYARFLGIGSKIWYTPLAEMQTAFDNSKMSILYNILDCYLMPSRNEGFGIPSIEAQACGIPVIVNDFSAQPELVKEGVTGEICKVAYRQYTPLGSYVGIPDYRDLLDKMLKIHETYTPKNKKAATKHIRATYSNNVVFPRHWKPFLDKVSEEIKKPF